MSVSAPWPALESVQGMDTFLHRNPWILIGGLCSKRNCCTSAFHSHLFCASVSAFHQTLPKELRQSVRFKYHTNSRQSDTFHSFNQTTVSYDASKEDKVEALKAKKAEVEERLREKI